MKFLASVVVIVSVVLTVQAEEKQFYRECVSATGVDEGLVTKSFRGEFPDDPKLKQFFHCFFKKFGVQDDSGELQLDVFRRKISRDLTPQVADKVIETCKDAKGADPAETAFQFYKCYWNAISNHKPLL